MDEDLADHPRRGNSCSVMYKKHRTEGIALCAPYGSGQNIVSDIIFEIDMFFDIETILTLNWIV